MNPQVGDPGAHGMNVLSSVEVAHREERENVDQVLDAREGQPLIRNVTCRVVVVSICNTFLGQT